MHSTCKTQAGFSVKQPLETMYLSQRFALTTRVKHKCVHETSWWLFSAFFTSTSLSDALLFCCISDKVAAQWVFAVVSKHLLLPPVASQPGPKHMHINISAFMTHQLTLQRLSARTPHQLAELLSVVTYKQRFLIALRDYTSNKNSTPFKGYTSTSTDASTAFSAST